MLDSVPLVQEGDTVVWNNRVLSVSLAWCVLTLIICAFLPTWVTVFPAVVYGVWLADKKLLEDDE